MTRTTRIIGDKLRRARSQLRHLPHALELVWTAAHGLTPAWVALLIVQGLLPVASVYLTRNLVNALLNAIRAHGAWAALRPALFVAGIMAMLSLLSEILRGVAGWLRTAQAELVQDHVSALIHQKSVAVDLAFYELPEFYDHLHRARAEANYRPVSLIENLGSLLQNAITLSAMLAVLIPFGPWLPAALLASTLPALYVVLRYALLQHDWRHRTTADERRSWYYDWLLTAGEAAAELRLFGLQEYFRTSFQHLRQNLRREKLDLTKAQARAELAAGTAGLLVSAAAMTWMGFKAIRGLVTLGDLALFYQAFQQGLGVMRSLLDHVGQLYQNTLFLGNLFEFLTLDPKVVDAPQVVPAPRPLQQGIFFREVSFRYPGRDRWVLRQCNLAIPAGQIATIVGPNGTGKSTLLKLLCRYYDPDAGNIEIDGLDLRAFSLGDLRDQIAVLFQEPVHYNATAGQNISMGDIRLAKDRLAIQAAAHAAGAEGIISQLPHGYDHLLGNWFEQGTELSVGEWQRIALARAFLRQAPIVIFDEPTSSMDPWAEADWLSRFRELVKGRTAIVITHRFTTAMFADVIHVMAEGQIVESGTHSELLAKRGLYSRGWITQMGSHG